MKILKVLLAVLGVAGVVGAGIYTYLGLGIPRRSSGQIRKETLQAVNTGRETEIRQRATGHAPATDADRPVDPDTRPRGGSHGNPR